MSKKEGGVLPSGQGGLIRYFDVDEGIKIKPEHVIAIGIGFIVFVTLLKFLV